MDNCENSLCNLVPKPNLKSVSEIALDEIRERFLKEGHALACAETHDLYLFLLSHADFYVSEVHSCETDEEGNEITFFAAAVDEAAYNEWESEIEHQHHPDEE